MRSKKNAKRAAQRRRAILTYAGSFALVLVCVGMFCLMSLSNGREPDYARTRWIVEDEGVEVLAAPVGGTLDTDLQGSAATLPFLQATPVPAPAEPAATIRPQFMPDNAPVTDAEADDAAAGSDAEAEDDSASDAEMEPESVTGPESATEPEAELGYVPITITCVGDCTLGGDIPRGSNRTFDSYVDNYGYDYFFANVRELFESDDLTIVNLEGPLTTSDDLRRGRAYNFRGRPDYVNILSGSSVEICNIANNHALDFGQDGFNETARVLNDAGIGVSGFNLVHLEEIGGYTVCSIGFTEWDFSEEEIVRLVGIAREQCDLLLVSMHWGIEGDHDASRYQQRMGRAIIDAGADIVIGTHTHVYGGVELYKGKYIIYSLGNFCFGGNRNPNDKNCLIFQQTFNMMPDGTVEDGGISLIPARISTSDDKNDFRPYILLGDRANTLLTKVIRVSDVDSSQVRWMDTSYQVLTGMVALNR